MSIIQNIFEIVEFVFLILLYFTCVIHLFRMGHIIATNIKTGQGGILEWFFLIVIILQKYFLRLHDTLWSKQKALIYSYVKNKYAIWILDSFLSYEVIKSEWTQRKWKNLILRASIYYIAFQCWYIPYSINICMFVLIIVEAAKDLIQDLIYPYQTSFNFHTLPFAFQQRFYELQKPVTRFRFSKAFFPLSLKSTYNRIYVDNLFIRRSKRCHMIYENFVRQQSSTTEIVRPSLTIGCNIDVECKCPEGILNDIYVAKAIYANSLLPGNFSHTLSTLNFENVKFLEIFQSTLNLNDFDVVSTMELKFVTLHICEHVSITIHDILAALIGVPHLRISYHGQCGSPEDFAVQLVEWVLENGYIESLLIGGYFFGEKLDFKSSTKIDILDTFDSLL